jgi:ubiquinone/menaquinone biosynthesis C-methylase UbiE
VESGLDVVGLDISGEAIAQLRERLPDQAHRLQHGDLTSLPPGSSFDVVIGIQVFQHGDRGEGHDNLALAQEALLPGGLFCLRVNAVGTDVWPEHEVVETFPDRSFTVRYLAGPKRGLLVHFFAREEIEGLFTAWETELSPRLDRTEREPADLGGLAQWEAIWRKPR